MRVRWVLILALSTLSSGAVLHGQVTHSQSEQAPGLSVSIQQPQHSINAGGDVTVTVTVTNISSQGLFVGPDLAFDVRDDGGSPVARVQPKPGSLPGGSAFSAPLEPGQSIDRSIDLRKEFVITTPGTYTVRALRGNYGARRGKVRNEIRSNSITIKIVR